MANTCLQARLLVLVAVVLVGSVSGQVPDLNDLDHAWVFRASRFAEGDADQSIFFKVSHNNGSSWTPHTVVASGDYAQWGPAFFYDKVEDELWLFYSSSGDFNERGVGRNWPGGDIKYVTTKNMGASWSEPVTVLPFYDPTRGNISKMTANKPIINSQGDWLLPFWQEAHTVNDTGPACSGVLVSSDRGDTWAPHGCIQANGTWLIENSLATTPTGVIQLFRTQAGYVFESQSPNGVDWPSSASPTTLLNPDSKVFVIDMDGTQVVAFNPSKTERAPLSLAFSPDGSGQEWKEYITIDSVELCPECPEFEYPTSQAFAGRIFTTYSASSAVGIRLAISGPPPSAS